jgi:hypothetical protein
MSEVAGGRAPVSGRGGAPLHCPLKGSDDVGLGVAGYLDAPP